MVQEQVARKKVLFYCDHHGAVSSIIALRCHFHRDDEAVFIGSWQGKYKNAFGDKIAATGIFDELMSLRSIFFELQNLATVEEQEQLVLSAYDKMFAEAGIDVREFAAIYISFDISNILGVYLSLKQCEFNILEISASRFADRRVYKNNPKLKPLQKKYDVLCGLNNKYIKRRLRFADTHQADKAGLSWTDYGLVPAFEETNEAEKDEVFDAMNLFYSIPESDKKAINDCFGADLLPLSARDACLVLPNSQEFAGVKGGLRILLYTILMDYYVDGYVCYIKEHPNITNMNLDRYVDAKFLDPFTPFEFYNLQKGLVINKSISIFSSISDKLANSIKLGMSYFPYFQLAHKLYCAFQLIEHLDMADKSYNLSGIDIDFVSKFAHYVLGYQYPNPNIVELSLSDQAEISVVIANGQPKETWQDIHKKIADNAIVIFLKEDEYFLNSELAAYTIPICIFKKATGNKCADEALETEFLYVFCKSAELREQVQGFSLSKNLKYTQMRISAEAKQLQELATVARSSRGLKQKLLGLIPNKKNRYKTRNIYPRWLIQLWCLFIPSKERRVTVMQKYAKK